MSQEPASCCCVEPPVDGDTASKSAESPASTTQAHPRPSHRPQLDALARIEGQIRGVRKMVEDERYCIDILVQMRSVHAALRRVERSVLKRHLETCVRGAFESGDKTDRDRKIDEIIYIHDWDI